MQDRYSGDIGDFGKYGLLRALSSKDGRRKLKIGVNWYLVPDMGNPGDGKFINYLRKDLRQRHRASLKNSDPQLYNLLKDIVFPKEDDSNLVSKTKEEANICYREQCLPGKNPSECISKRCIIKVEKRGVLPVDTLFYSKVLYSHPNSTIDERINSRDAWVRAGFDALKDCDMVFFDPDNGLQVENAYRYSQVGVKYVFNDEIAGYFKRGQSLIIYQHRDRSPEQIYINRLKNSITGITGRKDIKTIRLRYRRGTARDFIIIPNHKHPWHFELIETRIEAMLQTAWSDHFEKHYI